MHIMSVMHSLLFNRYLILAIVCLLTGASRVVADDGPDRAAAESDQVFGLTKIWKVHVHVTAENWKKMQPVGGFSPFGPPPGGGGPPRNSGGGRAPAAPRPGSFGFEFDYVNADVEFDGEAFQNVGLRLKGNGTYAMSSRSRKRPLKIDFNRFADEQKFHGIQQLNLHNNVMDPTHVRQALSYPVFQAAGVPSSRTAFAEVSLTIDGECDHEPLGIYTIVEEVDKAFLQRHFQTKEGLLLKPEGVPDLQYRGEDWSNYAQYEAKTKAKPHEKQRLIDLTRLIHQSDDQEFREQIGELLDTDQFARFLAANVLLSNMDSFLTNVHNYYLYLNPKTGKFVFLPWDLDLSMGAFFPTGTAEQMQDLSISHPHVGQSRLIERLLEWKEFDEVYRTHLRELMEKCFGKEGLTTKSLPVVRATLKDAIAREKERTRSEGNVGFPPGMPNPFANQPPLETFLAKRQASINDQLAGKSKGRVPTMSFGPPGGPRGGEGFGPGNALGPRFVELADADKNQKLSKQEFTDLGASWLRSWDKNKDQSLNATEVTDGLNTVFGPPPNAPPGSPKPPPGFGPGNFLGPPLLKKCDKDDSGEASAEEWTAQFESWFQSWDKGKDDRLEVTELIAGLNGVFGPPPGFGRPRPDGGERTQPPGNKPDSSGN